MTDPKPNRFEDLYVSRVDRFSLGRDRQTGEGYVSIPVSNALVDYEERYRLGADDLSAFLADPTLALETVEAARRREIDHLLIQAPGRDRGVAG